MARQELAEEIGDIDGGLHVILPAREVRALFEAIAERNTCPFIHSALVRLQRASGTQFAGSFGRRLVVTDEIKKLTAFEYDVYRRIVDGESRAEIAKALGVSKQRIFKALHRIYQKLGTAPSDAGLIHYAYRNGLVRL